MQDVVLTTTVEVMAVLDGTFGAADDVPRMHTKHDEGDEKGGARRKRNRAVWTEDDDRRLLALVERDGMHWRKLSAFFNASDDAIRNRWNRLRKTEAEDEAGGACSHPGSTRPRVMWTEEEDRQLEDALRNDRLNTLHLPRHPRSSWRNRVYRLGLEGLYGTCTRQGVRNAKGGRHAPP